MAIRAVVFDIGGVLEITPDLGITERWKDRLKLPAGEVNGRMQDVWADGSIGAITGVPRSVRAAGGVPVPRPVVLRAPCSVAPADRWRLLRYHQLLAGQRRIVGG
jgi:hypothetical protein